MISYGGRTSHPVQPRGAGSGWRADGDTGRPQVAYEGSRARLLVEDDGPGVSPDERERNFQRFYHSTEDGSGGCGLGLLIVREIAERHGGTATLVESDVGAKFKLVLPLPGSVRPTRSRTSPTPGSQSDR